nr:leucine-rich repeat domain-containing protein [Clostridia bacterium]
SKYLSYDKYDGLKVSSTIKNIVFPYNFNNYSKELFIDSTSLTKITIPPTVEYVDPNLELPKKAKIYYYSVSEGILSKYEFKNKVALPFEAKTLSISKDNIMKTHEIEDKYAYDSVEISNITSVIPKEFLKDFINIKNIILPNNIEIIKDSAFMNTRSLKYIEIPNSVKEIGHSAFMNSGIVEAVLSINMDTFSYSLFENCVNLTKISRYDNLVSVEKDCFKNCSSLKTIVFPKTVTSICSCIDGCYSLEDFIVSNDLHYFEYKSVGLDNLKNFFLPYTIDKIESIYKMPAISSLRGSLWKSKTSYNQKYLNLNREEYFEIINDFLYKSGFALVNFESKIISKSGDMVFDVDNNYQKSAPIKDVSHKTAKFNLSENQSDVKFESVNYDVKDNSMSGEISISDCNDIDYKKDQNNKYKEYFSVKAQTISSFIITIDITILEDVNKSTLYFVLKNESQGAISDFKKCDGEFVKNSIFSIQFNINKNAKNGPLNLSVSDGELFSDLDEQMKLNVAFRISDDLDFF